MRNTWDVAFLTRRSEPASDRSKSGHRRKIVRYQINGALSTAVQSVRTKLRKSSREAIEQVGEIRITLRTDLNRGLPA